MCIMLEYQVWKFIGTSCEINSYEFSVNIIQKGKYKMAELWDILDENGNKTGGLHERGKLMQEGEYHLVVNVWIRNDEGEFLISRRSKDKGHIWHTTGGAAVAGDDSLTTALKEAREEIGVTLDQKSGQFFKRMSVPHEKGGGSAFVDIWLFRQEVDMNTVTLQVEEICDAMWASEAEIRQMAEAGTFVSLLEWYPYYEELFCMQ